MDTREAAQSEIGARGAPGGLEAYRKDLARVLYSLRRVVHPEGRLFIVIADAEQGAEQIRADRIVEDAGRTTNWRLVGSASQPRAILGPHGTPRGTKREHLLYLTPTS
jgi:hypothetical protein